MNKIVLPLVAASALFAGAAQAATVSYTGSTGVSSGVSALSLKQFDASLGTLNAIDVFWDSGFSARFVAELNAPRTMGSVSGTDGFVLSTIVNTSAPVGASAPELSAAGGSAFSANVPPVYQQIVSGGESETVSYGALAAFIGAGTVDYSFSGDASDSSRASSGILRGVQDYLYLVNAEVTYTYDVPPVSVVPLPASAILLLAGLAGLGLARRKAS